MKKHRAMMVFCLVFSALLSEGQTTPFPGRNIESSIQRQKNGRFSCRVIENTGKPVKSFIPDKRSDQGIMARSGNPSQPAQTHHIAFHFDRPDCWNLLHCVGVDTIFTDMFNMVWTSQLTVEADMPDGYYELVSSMWGGNNDYYIVVKERFHVYKDMDTTLLSTSAIHNVTLLAVDENGDPLIGQLYQSGDGFGVNIEFQDGWCSPFFSECHTGSLPLSLNFSDVPPEMRLVMNRVFVTSGEQYHQYMISYPAMDGLANDTMLVNSASELISFPHIIHSTPAGNDYFLAWGYGSVENTSLTGNVDPFVAAFLHSDYPGNARDTVKLYLNHSAADTNKSFFGSFVDHLEENPSLVPSMIDLATPVTFLNENDHLVLSSEGAYPPVDCDYLLAPGSEVLMGYTAPYNVTWQHSIPGQQVIDLYAHFRGQVNERRYVDVSRTTFQIWDENSLLLQDSMRRSFHIYYYVPAPGLYKVVLSDSNYTLFGQQGYLQTDMIFDLSSPVDVCSPTMISFKTLQGDIVSPEILRGYPASVRFTAADYEYPSSGGRVYHSLSEVQLKYKKYDDNSWSSLPVSPVPEQFDSISGMPYVADLTPVMISCTDSALIDLMVILVDSSFYSTTQIMHPAFLLRDVATMNPPINPEIDFSIQPNPATDRMIISIDGFTGKESVILINSTGQKMLEQRITSEKTTIDISNFPQGVYFLELFSDRSAQMKNVIKL